MSRAFVIDPRDNVATALDLIEAGDAVALLGESAAPTIPAIEAIQPEHKIALATIPAGTDVLKYGMPIGYARDEIPAGGWVHLHNCASHYDARSNTLDHETGAPTDTEYA